MYSFDASSIIHAWDNYPIDNPLFDSLWNWFSDRISGEDFVISKIAFEEVSHKVPECGQWLRKNNIKVYPLSKLSLLIAKDIKDALEIIEEHITEALMKMTYSLLLFLKKEELNLSVKKEFKTHYQKRSPIIKYLPYVIYLKYK